MAEVKPFSAMRYNLNQVKPENVVAPPYDIISEAKSRSLYERDPYNIIRIELTQPVLEGCTADGRYEKAKGHLGEWFGKQILYQDKKDCFYLHELIFDHPFLAKKLTRIAVYGRIKVEPFSKKVVFPHERTHASPKIDRGKLLQAIRTNISPVFFLYQDPSQVLAKIYQSLLAKKPEMDFTDDMSIRNRLWVIDGENEIRMISSVFERRNIFIADGHHRYETALGYAEEMRAARQEAIARTVGSAAEVKNVIPECFNRGSISQLEPNKCNGFPLPRKDGAGPCFSQGKDCGNDSPATQPWDYALGAFVPFDDPGLLILPIHRVIRNSISADKERLLANLKASFNLRAIPRVMIDKIAEGDMKEGFGMAFSEAECFLLELKEKSIAKEKMPAGKPEDWYQLDVNLISYLIVEPLLKITNADLEKHVTYTPDVREVFKHLKSGEAFCAFFVKPVTTKKIKDICETGEVMPQKSTYFYPKFPSGLVMYRH
ncbi:MAG: hypothetical protein A3G33_05630 [Omnitrophica bacterium RIFCSPLOWO2_12_FULL_44_17]|uniref:DUF1015 domain-containing protein n=1 Tax=Candidatus Danuiimicrobium aquiferis TaxID=1801832 RepID=A0A1G1L326_9BACT|nr:MAG: hypothetical protein A3B72_05110 [Omnitrophica bacterium RIFCSPHIGHO2_02_FULL_45_28]OGW99553.1 MAG: hypothetical protein A3G33_05630 [Omnitrophica bacterium RIFCSPLOWO2_12_FULL_44_17]OGX04002.1 MAG: hypothetical protein A3J12_06170 [Omnitrophica bacterium RIFCSPLOWO2_02_FULL_44_11]